MNPDRTRIAAGQFCSRHGNGAELRDPTACSCTRFARGMRGVEGKRDCTRRHKIAPPPPQRTLGYSCSRTVVHTTRLGHSEVMGSELAREDTRLPSQGLLAILVRRPTVVQRPRLAHSDIILHCRAQGWTYRRCCYLAWSTSRKRVTTCHTRPDKIQECHFIHVVPSQPTCAWLGIKLVKWNLV